LEYALIYTSQELIVPYINHIFGGTETMMKFIKGNQMKFTTIRSWKIMQRIVFCRDKLCIEIDSFMTAMVKYIIKRVINSTLSQKTCIERYSVVTNLTLKAIQPW